MTEIYLSGPICGNTFEDAAGWRKTLADLLAHGIHALDPLRGKGPLLAGQTISNETSDRTVTPSLHPMLTPKGITVRDRLDVMNCDAMVIFSAGMNRDRLSAGTMIEMGWADAWRKPIIWVDASDDQYAINHPMVSELVSYRAASLSEAADIINHMFATSR